MYELHVPLVLQANRLLQLGPEIARPKAKEIKENLKVDMVDIFHNLYIFQVSYTVDPWPRPNRWSLFSHMVSVRPPEKKQKNKMQREPCVKKWLPIGCGLVGHHLKFARIVFI